MECEGADRIFQRSSKKHKLKYVNCLVHGAKAIIVSRMFIIKDVDPDTKVIKLECVGYYQKRV